MVGGGGDKWWNRAGVHNLRYKRFFLAGGIWAKVEQFVMEKHFKSTTPSPPSN